MRLISLIALFAGVFFLYNFIFRRQISELSQPIAAKLCRVIGRKCSIE